MATLNYDRKFEAGKKKLLEEGIQALGIKLDNSSISQKNLGNYLYTMDIDKIDRDSTIVWMELLSENAGEVNLRYTHERTMLWLAGGGFKEINELIPDRNCLNYLWNFQEFWGEVMGLVADTKEERYCKPSILQWGLYITVRGNIPEYFQATANEGYYTYAIKRWAEIRRLVERDEAMGISQLASLSRRLRELHTAAETYIAKEDGNYSQLRAQRLASKSVDLDKVSA